jgi:hypothetical protein
MHAAPSSRRLLAGVLPLIRLNFCTTSQNCTSFVCLKFGRKSHTLFANGSNYLAPLLCAAAAIHFQIAPHRVAGFVYTCMGIYWHIAPSALHKWVTDLKLQPRAMAK